MRSLMLMVLVACGDKDTDTSTDTEDSGGEETTALDCETETWADNGDAAFMSACVLPTMATHFQGYDADAHADFSCASCHGADLNGGTYAMPGAVAISVREQDPNSDIYQFMSGTVVPEMAGILGLEPYDPSTGSGEFSCYSCHLEAR